MRWKKIGQRRWRCGDYEITWVISKYVLWKNGKLVCTPEDLDKSNYFNFSDEERLKYFAADCEIYELVS